MVLSIVKTGLTGCERKAKEMSVTLLNALLWIPFGIVVTIAGAIFLTSGYKRGLWRALISMGATAVATVASMLIANLLSKPIANSVLKALPPMTEADGSLTPEIMTNLVKGVIGVVLSLVLFSVLLFVFSIVLKYITNRIKNEKLDVDKKSLKWAGLGVRVVDTVLFALLLMLPLYGTIATYAPAAQTVLQMQNSQDSEVQAYVEAVSSHPVVQMSGVGPASWVYTGLSDMQMNEGSVNVADMAQTMGELAKRVETISTASEDQIPELIQELIQYTRKNVIEQPWCYDLAQEALAMMEASMRQGITQEDQSQVDAFLKLFEMSRDEFKENGVQILDFASYLLETGVLENEEKAEQVMRSEDFLARLGALLNCTDQAVAGKNLMLQMTIQEDMFRGNTQEATAFLEGRLSTEATAKEQQTQEAEAFLMLLQAGSWEERVEALLKMPSFAFSEEDMDKLPDPMDWIMEYVYGDMFITDGEDGSVGVIVDGELPDGLTSSVIVGGDGEISEGFTGTIIWGGDADDPEAPTFYTMIVEDGE